MSIAIIDPRLDLSLVKALQDHIDNFKIEALIHRKEFLSGSEACKLLQINLVYDKDGAILYEVPVELLTRLTMGFQE